MLTSCTRTSTGSLVWNFTRSLLTWIGADISASATRFVVENLNGGEATATATTTPQIANPTVAATARLGACFMAHLLAVSGAARLLRRVVVPPLLSYYA